MFSVYPRIIENSVPSLIITKKTKTIHKTTKEVRCFYTKQQVIDTLVIWNGPNIITTLEFPI
jgi:Zn/Cd-binding protein ZinT